MSRILQNSSGAIHVEDSKIMLLPIGRTTESCACCGPPQPPPPECTRCYFGEDEDGLPIWGAPYKKDFAVVISDTTDQVRYKITHVSEQFTYEAPDRLTGQPGCGCTKLNIEAEFEVIVNGFSALNGTYYGLDGGTYDADSTSTKAECNNNDLPFDPYHEDPPTDPPTVGTITPSSGCEAVDDCDYFCEKQVWIKDVPISGTLYCKYHAIKECSDRPDEEAFIEISVTVSGYATIFGSPHVYQYGDGIPAAYTISAVLEGQASVDYGSRYYKVTIFNGRVQDTSGFDCYVIPASPQNQNGCPPGTSISTVNHDCFPFWRLIAKASATTCDNTSYNTPDAIIDQPVCDIEDTDSFSSDIAIPCPSGISWTATNTAYRSAFYSKLDHLWTDV